MDQKQIAKQMIQFNKTTFEKAGLDVPTTWDELITVGQALTFDADGNGSV